MADETAQLLAGKYRLIRQLGQGGMGAVWQAEHVTLHAMVAIKLLDPTMAVTRDGLTRFLREAQAAAALRSPHIVQILDHGIDRNTPYIAMELLDGESLGVRLERLTRLSPFETARIIAQISRAMTRAHEVGIVHRDLKPDNIFLVPNDDEEVVKVLDFGIAKTASPLSLSANDSTRTGTMLGTPYYMSPEQVESASSADYRSDIWALGVIAYQCILGKRPFEGETVGALFLAICSKDLPVPSTRGAVPAGFDAWFARACSRSVRQRFATAREAATELRRVCGDAHAALASAQTELSPPAASFGDTTARGAAVGVSTPPPSAARRSLGWPLVLSIGVLAGGLAAWQVMRPAQGQLNKPEATGERATATQPPPPSGVPASPSVATSVELPLPPPSGAPAQSAAAAVPSSTDNAAAHARSATQQSRAPRTASAAPQRSASPRGKDVDLGL